MRRLLTGIAIITLILTVFLIYNHNQHPNNEDVFKITENWSPATEQVYMVRKIDGEWLTIFRSAQSILVARLEQNWMGFWEFKDDVGAESSLVSTYYPPAHDGEFTWVAAGTEEGEPVYYFGQIINPNIKDIKVETQVNTFEDALLFNLEEARFFFVKSEEKVVSPVNIRGFSESGKLIYSTFKED
ncbi:hypothetical protein [Aquisalibacillus elongatus]|uniref:Uncharacterized protein n=1 Tax=Aquisalibacillus elongatus TaxID=485577 RepID=A0A3N5BET8_9BACI|nr:hypothetical protein [Aquisalibacillus elongatus]RPF55399.1 hypothetical protein EDC24_0270 [Aquisalibacillus elongatus]